MRFLLIALVLAACDGAQSAYPPATFEPGVYSWEVDCVGQTETKSPGRTVFTVENCDGDVCVSTPYTIDESRGTLSARCSHGWLKVTALAF